MHPTRGRRVVDKTANYTVTAALDRNETLFTNRGASGAVTFTLPPPGARYLGWRYEFLSVENQNLIVAGATAGDVVALNDAAANSVAASTTNQKIGAHIIADCIRTGEAIFKWFVRVDAVGVTQTIAT